MADYQPIACVVHERLEFAVLKRRQLKLACRDGVGDLAGLPLDVYTRDGAEWLRLRAEDGHEHVLRLDRIESFVEI
ncbi:MAG: transcriptional antiterminator, Rof [Gallionellaceae bacterium]|nr:transcriptional antiterminator, Rof [Gallionellaceae bacterium]